MKIRTFSPYERNIIKHLLAQMGAFNLLFFLISTLLPILVNSTQIDSSILTTNQTVRDGETISSAGGNFELGFFSPGKSKNRYLGIWYKKISHGTVVWVANRAIPITDTSGVLKLDNSGILVLTNSTDNVVWSSNTSTSPSYPVAQLLDSGNLVVRDGINDTDSSDNFLWQSFDYPGDTFLPDMKFGKNFVSGLDSYLSSWTSPDDPSPGNITNRFDTNGYPQIFLRKGSDIQFRSGPWNGLRFSGMPNLKPNPIYTFELVFNPEVAVYYEYQLVNSSVVSRMVLSWNGLLQRFIWINRTQGWVLYLTAQMDDCDRYALCGPYGSCNINNSPACGCLTGFEPKFPQEWNVSDWSGGCVRRTQLECGNGDGFLKYPGVKLPDTRWAWFSESMNLEECKRKCLSNCSCTAYSNLDIRDGGSGCLNWFGGLVDIRQYAEDGQDLYVRMAASELGSLPIPQAGSNGKKLEIMVIMLTLLTGSLLIALSMTLYVHKKKMRQQQQQQQQMQIEGRAEPDSIPYTKENRKEGLELPLFDFATIANATNYFSIDNKLGEGGFGPVYKGMLETGQEIAVKRLSKESRQGIDEFTNEVHCIAKLQHRNLVKLLGYCIQGEEKMLIYEYMPNGSLDAFIFDQTKSKTLGWPERFRIISGIAKGLLYLHQDSRLRVIHRDLKAGNVLLDFDMNPKISDFGTARSFGGNETQANTKRVIGTYGYMSPEYMVDGLFSVKSDVFSFGVLVLEIISGRKNKGFSHPDHKHNLLGHAWRLYNEGRSLELVDAPLGDSAGCVYEVLRTIHVGLLCVQQRPEDRPSMSTLVLMLGSDGSLPPPKQPGFFMERNIVEGECSSSNYAASSANEVTVTLLVPR